MYRLIPIFLLISNIFNAQANGINTDNRISKFNLQTGLGLSYLILDPFDENMHLGLNYKVAFLYNTPSNKISFGPIYENRSFSKEFTDDIKNKLRFNSIGMTTSLSLYQSENKNIWFSNYCSFKYTFINDKLKATESNGTNTNEQSLFKGESIAIDIGYKLKFGAAFFDIGFELLNTQVRDQMSNGDTNDSVKLGLNNLHIGLGLEIPIKYIDHKYVP